MLDTMLLVYKRPDLLRLSLDSYIACHGDYPHRLWIQVNCKTPEVREILEEYRPRLKFLKEIKYNFSNLGLSRSTNYFWMKAKAEFIVKIDSDIIFEPDFLKILHESMVNVRKEDHSYFVLHGRHTENGGKSYFCDGNAEVNVGGVTLLNNAHGGGCEYIAHLQSLRTLGPLQQNIGNIYGWTRYQHAAGDAYGYKLAMIKKLRCEHLGVGEEYEKANVEYSKEIWDQRH